MWSGLLAGYYDILRVFYAANNIFKTATIRSLMQTKWIFLVGSQKTFWSEKGMDISIVSPYSLPPGGSVFPLARNWWIEVVVERRCLRWSGRHYSKVVSTIMSCKTHDWSAQPNCNKQLLAQGVVFQFYVWRMCSNASGNIKSSYPQWSIIDVKHPTSSTRWTNLPRWF